MEILFVLFIICLLGLMILPFYQWYKTTRLAASVQADKLQLITAARQYATLLQSDHLPLELDLKTLQQQLPQFPWQGFQNVLGVNYQFRFDFQTTPWVEITFDYVMRDAARFHQCFQASGEGTHYYWRMPLTQIVEKIDPPLSPSMMNLAMYRRVFDLKEQQAYASQ